MSCLGFVTNEKGSSGMTHQGHSFHLRTYLLSSSRSLMIVVSNLPP